MRPQQMQGKKTMALDIPNILSKLAARHNKKFMYQGKELPLDRVFAYDGALPVFVRRANTMADFLFGKKLGVSLTPDPETLTGELVKVLPTQSAFVLVMLLYDVMEEMVINAGKGDVILA